MPPKKTTQRKGSKPIYNVTNSSIQSLQEPSGGSASNETQAIVMRLQAPLEDDGPVPYDPIGMATFEESPFLSALSPQVLPQLPQLSQPPTQTQPPTLPTQPSDILLQHLLPEGWPMLTTSACLWCCHRFDTPPMGIPIKQTSSGGFHMIGNFCSLECAASHNFSSHESIDVMWERHHLLNALKLQLWPHDFEALRCAPEKSVLSFFGGHMTIDEFRRKGRTSQFTHVLFPPMTMEVLQVDEINESDVSRVHYVPIDMERIKKYREKVMLRRTKPLMSGQRLTLDNTMNIQVNNSQASQ
jgi:hypothetical protein